MNIALFNRKYIARKFGEQKEVKGYLTAGYRDVEVRLHIHPVGSDQIQALPEGERKIRRLEGHGTDVLVVADHNTNQQGDLLYYDGEWYECVSAQRFDHTLLSHYNYQFVIVPKDASSADITPPLLVEGCFLVDEDFNYLVDENKATLVSS